MAKRTLDIFVASMMLLLLLPLFAIVALLMKIESPGPVFFRQKRVGKGSRVFELIKFRSMIVNADQQGLRFEVAKNDSRITGIGRRLREWGIDELPQLVNVLKGDMSMVGPRAARPDQVELFTENELRRNTVKPGITGWALIKGRNLIGWKRRIELDLWYVENMSLWLDIVILFKTLWVVLVTREGVYGPEGVTRDYPGRY